jgi:glutamine amidotransferase PdxT
MSEGQPVLIRQKQILISTFHPELSTETVVHEYFLAMAGANGSPANGKSQKFAWS